MMDSQILLEEELQVLESIYPDYILELSSDIVFLEVPIELGIARRISVNSGNKLESDSSDAAAGSSSSSPFLKVSHLPPILLSIQLPSGYPMTTPPGIASIHATHSWLPNEGRLASLLQESWFEGEGVLCTWVELLRSGDFLDKLGLIDKTGAITLPRTGSSHPALPQLLLAHDLNSTAKQFAQNSYPCSICFSSIKGARCIRLECSHVFCRECLQDFWSFCIADGSVERVGCADPTCVKEARQASEEEVRRVVSDKEVVRWKWLRTKKEIEKDPTIVHCPIPACQAAVPKPPTDPKESFGWDRFRSCAACGFNFCSFCKHTWHGPLSECPKSVTHSLVMEYLDLPSGSPGRAALERRFGKTMVLKLVRDYEEEKSTGEWLQNSTTTCPGCQIPVEKSIGCNHMICARCKQHFCYRCGEKLSALDPYTHFSRTASECYGKLFDVNHSTEEDGWQPVELFEAL